MKKEKHLVTIAALVVLVAVTAGWGPRTELAIVNTAVQLISQEGNIPLKRLGKHVQAGAAISDDEMEAMFSTYESAPVQAVESQIDLLKTVKGDQIDPYFAYRLGTLGKLVASVTAPMFDANPQYKKQYYNDVDQAIERTDFQSSSRQVVDSAGYFDRIMGEAAAQEAILEQEYAEGTGFQGVARSALSQDASRSIQAVADVWYTILTQPVTAGTISDRQIRDYILGAIEYYIARGNMGEINAAYDRLMQLGISDAELFQELGNAFFDAGMYERAVTEYQKVLARNPNNREVAERMAEYYARMGEQALERGDLETALDEFTSATEANKLHPTAQQSLMQVEKLIAERNARRAQEQADLEAAQELLMEAERLAGERQFALAISRLADARSRYTTISDEFPEIQQQANLGLKQVQTRVSELEQDLIGNAQMLSGTGYIVEAQQKAAETDNVSEEGLRSLTQSAYREQLRQLRDEYESVLQEP